MSPEAAAIVVGALGLLGALVQGWRTAQVARETLEQAKVIHVAVNSNLTAVRADLVIANNRIAELLKVIKAQAEAEKT